MSSPKFIKFRGATYVRSKSASLWDSDSLLDQVIPVSDFLTVAATLDTIGGPELGDLYRSVVTKLRNRLKMDTNTKDALRRAQWVLLYHNIGDLSATRDHLDKAAKALGL